MKQVNQKPISAKIDIVLLAEMELYCQSQNIKRNRLINLALNEYLSNHKI